MSNEERRAFSSCEEETFTAHLSIGHWIGYEHMALYGAEKDLLYSYCPYDQCSNSDNNTLPNSSSAYDLNRIVCGDTREGRLCSMCKKEYATMYHDPSKTCKTSNTCKWGWFLYIITEILPVTLLFILLMIFNIKLTSGDISGFILFCQISRYVLFTRSTFSLPAPIKVLHLLYCGFLAGLWNLQFFEIKELSFCLWRSATTMDLLAFKYITIFYSLLLVIIIVLFIKYCHNFKVLIKVHGRGRSSTKNTIIHGISGFLIICYWECIDISLKLLTSVKIVGKDENGNYYEKYKVPLSGGDLKYFHDKHLYYAIPAMFVLFFLGILPPLILFLYPLCYNIFSIFRIAESKLVTILCIIIPLEKFKPFFDSFQYSFKDNYRCFSGLYFLYRFSLLLIVAFADYTKFLSTYIHIQLIFMLAVQAICQPHKLRWHNVLDTLLFLNLTVVHTIDVVKLHHVVYMDNAQYYINIMGSIQVLLLYIPIAYITLYVGKRTVMKLKNWRRVTSEPTNDYHEMTDSFQLRT